MGEPICRVVNLRKAPFDVYIGRAGNGEEGFFGNPYSMQGPSPMSRDDCLQLYRRYFLDRITTDTVFRERVMALRGKTLGCFCAPQKCHGDIIAEWVNAQYRKSGVL